MKTKLALCTLSLCAMMSCEQIPTEVIVNPSEVTFNAIVENSIETRTSISNQTNTDGNYSLLWSSGDVISIYDGVNNATYQTSSNEIPTAVFQNKSGRVVSDAASYTAFYPSEITPDNMTLPATQTYKDEDVIGFPMRAISNDRNLEFKNLCGIVRVSLKAEDSDAITNISSISLSANNKGMSGEFSIGSDDAAIVDGSDGVILSCSTSVELSQTTATDFNIIVPKGDYNPLNMKICDSNGREVNLVSESAITVNRGEITKISLTLKSSSFDSSLEDIPITDSDVEFAER